MKNRTWNLSEPAAAAPSAATHLAEPRVGAPGEVGRAVLAVLLLGPAATILALTAAISSGALTTLPASAYLGVALIFWSPLPISVPAVLLEAHRDAALPELRGAGGRALRAVLLLPWLMTSPASRARVATAVSLVGFAAACMLAYPAL